MLCKTRVRQRSRTRDAQRERLSANQYTDLEEEARLDAPAARLLVSERGGASVRAAQREERERVHDEEARDGGDAEDEVGPGDIHRLQSRAF